MEQWQIKHIQKNFYNLTNFSSWNVQIASILEQEEILSSGEITELNEQSPGNAVYTLYRMIQNKANGYETLCGALLNTCQSGAYNILIDGYERKLLSLIQQDFPSFKIEDVKEILKKEELQAEYKKKFIPKYQVGVYNYSQQPENFVIVNQTVPKLQSTYVQRLISNRVLLDRELFQDNNNKNDKILDVFVFKGLQQSEISILAMSCNSGTITSREKILDFNNKQRFVRLDESDEHEHWPKLVERSKSHKYPLHLIKVENVLIDNKNVRNYILEQTIGNTDNIRKYWLDSERKQEDKYISEKHLVDTLLNSASNVKAVCICGSPGMGKSWLMGSLAEKFQNEYGSNKFAALFSVSDVLEVIPEIQNSELNQSKAFECILKKLCPQNLLSKEILRHALNTKCASFCLFLDGFDEIAKNHQDSMIAFLEALINGTQSIKVVVTSRKHMKQTLEKELDVLAYDILPFNHSTQASYLSDHWHKHFKNTDPELLQNFASTLLTKLRDGMNAEGKDIFGNPFMCYMVAEVFGNQAELYQISEEYQNIKISSQYGIYETFFKMRVSFLYVSKQFLIWKAFTVLFPTFADKIKPILGLSNESSEQYQLSCGILHKCKRGDIFKTEFIHQTLAEFLVAEYLGQSIFSEKTYAEMRLLGLPLTMEQDKCVILFFADEILDIELISITHIVKPTQPCLENRYINIQLFTCCGILNFLDSYVHIYCQYNIENSQMIILKKNYLPTKLINLFKSCIFHNFVYIFRALCTSLRTKELEELAELQSWLGPPRFHIHSLIMAVVTYSGREMLESCFEFFEQVCIQKDDIFRYGNYPISPMLVAMQESKYRIVETLLFQENKYKAGKAEHHIVELCMYVSHTKSLSEEKIEYRKIMCDLLLRHNKCLIKQSDENGCTVLHRSNMHLELIKFLISKNADITATDKHNRTFIHWVIRYMTSNCFHELCEYLFEKCGNTELIKQAKTLFAVDKKDSNNLLGYVLKHFKGKLQYDTLKIILKATKIDIDSLFLDDIFGTINLLMAAVLGNQSIELIKQLVDRGINTEYTNEMEFNVLSIAVEMGNVQYADFFYSLKVSIDKEKVIHDQRNFEKAYELHSSQTSDEEREFRRALVKQYFVLDEGDFSTQDTDRYWELFNANQYSNQSFLRYLYLPLKNKIENYLSWRVFDVEEIGYCWEIYKDWSVVSLCNKVEKAVKIVNHSNTNPSNVHYDPDEYSMKVRWRGENDLTLLSKSLSDARHFDLSSKHKLLKFLTESPEILPPCLIKALDLDATKRVKDTPSIIELAARAKVWGNDMVKCIFLLDMNLSYLDPTEMISLYKNLLELKTYLQKEDKKPTIRNIEKLLKELLLTLLKEQEFPSQNTYFHYAASYYDETGFNATIQTLQKHGLDNLLRVRNSKGQTPLHLAISHDCFGLQTLDILTDQLTETGGSGSKKPKVSAIDWNESDNDGHSYIHYALFRTDKDMSFFERLVKLEGIDLSKTDNENRSIAEICYSLGLTNHSKVLKDLGENDFEDDLEPKPFNQIEKFFNAEIFPRKLFETAVTKSYDVHK